MNKPHEYIYQLLETKDFKELSAVEVEMVLATMSEEEYTNQRNTLLASMEVFDQEAPLLIPDVEIFASLKKRTSEVQSPSVWWSFILPFFQWKMPVYQTGFAVLLAFFLFRFYSGERTTKIEYVDREVVVYQPVFDTVLHEKIKEVPVEKVVYRQSVSEPQGVRTRYVERNQGGLVPPSEMPNIREIQTSFGNSPIDPSDLDQFRVSM